MSLTFREKSLWLLLLSLLVAFGAYLATAFSAASANVALVHVADFIGMVIALVIFQVVSHILLAIASHRELAASIQSDERDDLIRLKSTQRASYVLGVGVFFSLCLAVLVAGNFVFVHVLLAFWVLAQATEIVSQLILYRRGV